MMTDEEYEQEGADYMQMLNCIDGYHADPVSGCCGDNEHEHVDGMCSACNEFSGWECPVCETDITDLVY